MKLLSGIFAAMAIWALPSLSHANDVDCYVLHFMNGTDNQTKQFSIKLGSIDQATDYSIEDHSFDVETKAKWEKAARLAFDLELVDAFNKFIGMSDVAAIVDGDTKQLLGCLNNSFSGEEALAEVNRMCEIANGPPPKVHAYFDSFPIKKNKYVLKANATTKTTQCPR